MLEEGHGDPEHKGNYNINVGRLKKAFKVLYITEILTQDDDFVSNYVKETKWVEKLDEKGEKIENPDANKKKTEKDLTEE